MSMAYMAKPKRNISEADRAAAKRLRAIWAEFKKKTRLSQETAASRIGISQAAFSQYLRCEIALNTDITAKFAQLLGVKPDAIRTDRDFSGLKLEQPSTAYQSGLSDEALDVAFTWQSLPPHRRRAFRDSLFLECAVAKHFPWLQVGKPDGDYEAFERRLEKAAKTVQLKLAL